MVLFLVHFVRVVYKASVILTFPLGNLPACSWACTDMQLKAGLRRKRLDAGYAVSFNFPSLLVSYKVKPIPQ